VWAACEQQQQQQQPGWPVPDRLWQLLQDHKLTGAVQRLQQLEQRGLSIATAAQATAALGIPAGHVTKSVAIMAGGQPLVAVARGDCRLDMRKAGGRGRGWVGRVLLAAGLWRSSRHARHDPLLMHLCTGLCLGACSMQI
jgi:hypothetical protein